MEITLYLSSIPVETGNDPNKLWPGKRWIRNPYRIHQRLQMAFDGKPNPRVLFRIEGPVPTSRGLRPRILVQSQQPPDWDAAFGNAPFLVIPNQIQVKPYKPQFRQGQTFAFRLRANPTFKKKQPGSKQGKRLGIMSPEGKHQWFQRKAQQNGFKPIQYRIIPEGLQRSRRSKLKDPNPHTHLAATFTGILQVTDPHTFTLAIANGIGTAKAYGFGLLSLAPA